MNDLSSTPPPDPARNPARFTAAEFLPLAEAAASLDIRLELADGVLERMSPPSDDHSHYQTLAVTRLVRALGEVAGGLLRIEVGVRLDRDTIRVPDLLLLKEPGRVQGVRDPASVRLVIEVAETTLGVDLGIKRVEYARAGVGSYWVIDTRAHLVHAFADPADGDYRTKVESPFTSPLPVPGTDAAITLA